MISMAHLDRHTNSHTVSPAAPSLDAMTGFAALDCRFIANGGETLESVAKQHGMTIRAIKKLNPTYFPPEDEDSHEHSLYCGQALTLDPPDLKVSLPPPPSEVNDDLLERAWRSYRSDMAHGVYVVRRGEKSLRALADRYGTTVSAVRDANREVFPFGDPGQLHAGMQIIIPPPDCNKGQARMARQAEVLEVVARTSPTGKDIATSPIGGGKHRTYRARVGDTLLSVARAHNMDLDEFRKLNQIPACQSGFLKLPMGNRIYIVNNCEFNSTEWKNASAQNGKSKKKKKKGTLQTSLEVYLQSQPHVHAIGPDETAHIIATQHNISVKQLRMWNPHVFPPGERVNGVLPEGELLQVAATVHTGKGFNMGGKIY